MRDDAMRSASSSDSSAVLKRRRRPLPSPLRKSSSVEKPSVERGFFVIKSSQCQTDFDQALRWSPRYLSVVWITISAMPSLPARGRDRFGSLGFPDALPCRGRVLYLELGIGVQPPHAVGVSRRKLR